MIRWFALWPWAVFLVGVATALALFFAYFVPGFVHGDITAHFIIAEAIQDSGTPFPADFYYGNDLIFLRNQFSIVLAQLLGLEAYASYAVGSAVNIVVCVLLVALVARRAIGLTIAKAFLLTILVFLPLGFDGYDYMLTEQSHLPRVTLILCSAILVHTFLAGRSAIALGGVFAALAIYVTDSPPRGLLATAALLGGVLVVALVRRTWRGRIAASAGTLLLALMVGIAANALIASTVTITGVAHNLQPNPANFAYRFGYLIYDFFYRFVGVSDLFGGQIYWTLVPVLLLKVLVGVGILGAAYFGGRSAFRQKQAGGDLTLPVFLVLPAIAFSVLGLVLVAATSLYLEIRHIQPGLYLLKTVLILWLLGRAANSVWRHLVLVGVFVGASFLGAFASGDWLARHLAERAEHNVRFVAAAQQVVADRQLDTPVPLYGTFWNSMRYEIFAPDLIASAPVNFDGDNMWNAIWLSRPSRYCLDRPVLLAVSDGEPELKTFAETRYAMVGRADHISLFLANGQNLVNCGE